MILKGFTPGLPKGIYARWTVGGGKSPIKWAKKPPTTRKSIAKLSHIAKVQGRLKPALAIGERLRVLNTMFYPLGHGWPLVKRFRTPQAHSSMEAIVLLRQTNKSIGRNNHVIERARENFTNEIVSRDLDVGRIIM